jgi:O-6-methylguanine DNA methyltransferase
MIAIALCDRDMRTEPHPYATVAAAIRFVRSRARQQPTLDAIAAHVGLSPAHLQRVFVAWVGISPKRFVQFLTRQHAKTLLRESRDVLSTALDAGLSGPGRLHDLMVTCDALTPGEIGALGRGLTIRYGFAASPFGEFLVGITARGICHLHFVEPGMAAVEVARLLGEWPNASFARDDAAARQLAAERFDALAPARPLGLLLRGSNFQLKVWEALLRIPAGRILSYRDVATLAGHAHAQRAVGSAMARNAVALLIPCHRVIRENGDAGHYRWGDERKHAMIGWEQAQTGAKDRDSLTHGS